MDTPQLPVSIAALVVSLLSFGLAWLADVRSRRAEAVKNLLGEKETVGYAALKLLRDGLPKKKADRELVMPALIQASILEGSDRARALVYRVIEQHLPASQSEIQDAFNLVEETYKRMDRYSFTKDELDLARGERRLNAVRKIMNGGGNPPATTAGQ